MSLTRTQTNFGIVQIGIVLLTLVTAFVHIWINLDMGGFIFILNGLGYLALLVALFIPQSLVDRFLPANLASRYRKVVRTVFIAYTLLTILLWVAMGTRSTLAYVDKAAEILLVILLWLDRARS
jgi:hypothetical protein